MLPFEIFLYAIALSMDAFAVSLSAGLLFKKPTKLQYSRLALAFAMFQCAMTYLGYIFGRLILYYIAFLDGLQKGLDSLPSFFDTIILYILNAIASFCTFFNLAVSHSITNSLAQFSQMVLQVIASILLLLLGVKMLKDSFHKDDKDIPKKDPSSGFTLIMLAFATSIDAFVAGLSLCFLNNHSIVVGTNLLGITSSSLMIGFVCGGLSVLGVKLGTFLAKASMIGQRAELLGGLTLIGIGLYNLISL